VHARLFEDANCTVVVAAVAVRGAHLLLVNEGEGEADARHATRPQSIEH
jgi:hypothetical protein